jgi:hypothetical protein
MSFGFVTKVAEIIVPKCSRMLHSGLVKMPRGEKDLQAAYLVGGLCVFGVACYQRFSGCITFYPRLRTFHGKVQQSRRSCRLFFLLSRTRENEELKLKRGGGCDRTGRPPTRSLLVSPARFIDMGIWPTKGADEAALSAYRSPVTCLSLFFAAFAQRPDPISEDPGFLAMILRSLVNYNSSSGLVFQMPRDLLFDRHGVRRVLPFLGAVGCRAEALVRAIQVNWCLVLLILFEWLCFFCWASKIQ